MKRKSLLEIAVLFLFSLVPILWLSDGSIILGHDSGFRLKYFAYLVDLFYSWNPHVGFGADLSINKGFLITQLPETMFSFFLGGLHNGQIATLIFWFFMIGLSMYIFTYTLFPKPHYWFLRIFASLLYMFNFFVLQGWFIAERAKFSLMIALPLSVLLLYMSLLRKWSYTISALLFGLLFLLFNGGGSPPLYGSILLSIVVVACVLTIVNIHKNGLKDIFYTLKVLSLFFLVAFFCNAYWIFPQIHLAISSYSATLSAQGGVEGTLAWEAVVSKFTSMSNLLRLQGIPDWYENPIHPYASMFLANNVLIVLSFFPITIISFGLYAYTTFQKDNRRDIVILLFLVFLLVGLLFAGGTHPPFGVIYQKLILYIPGFAIFRSSFYKFGPIVWFAMSFLTAYFLYGLLASKKQKLLRFLLVGVSIVYFFIFSKPFFTSDFFKWHPIFSTKVAIPEYVHDTAHYINNETVDSERTLLFPGSINGADQYSWGFWSLDSLPRLAFNRSVVSNDSATQNMNGIYDSLYANDIDVATEALSKLDVTSMLVRNDVYERSGVQANYTPIVSGLVDQSQGKDFGAWQYYPLSESSEVFSVPKEVIKLSPRVDIAEAVRVLPSGDDTIFIQSPTDSDFENSEVIHSELVRLSCTICSPLDYWRIEKGVQIPSPSILPNSLLYSFIREKEMRESSSAVTPAGIIDVALSHSTRRIAEIEKMASLQVSDLLSKHLVETIKRYLLNLESIEQSFAQLADHEKNFYAPRVIAYLSVHNRFSESVIRRHRFSIEEFNTLLISQQKLIDLLSKDYEILETIQNYSFSLPKPGEFYLVSENIENFDVFSIDNKEISDISRIALSSGNHFLSVRRPPLGNLLVEDQAREVHLEYGDKRIIPFVGIDASQKYLIQVKISEVEGVSPTLKISEKVKGETAYFPLVKNDFNRVHDSFVYEYKPHVLTTGVNLELGFEGYAYESSSFRIDKLQISPYVEDGLFLRKEDNTQATASARVTDVMRYDPTFYSASISNPGNPFVLTFNQSFNPGWKTYVLSGKYDGEVFFLLKTLLFNEPIDEENHFIVNTYANGWIIEDTGDFDVLVFYFPQLYFYLGLGVSIVAIVGVGGVGIIVAKRRYESA